MSEKEVICQEALPNPVPKPIFMALPSYSLGKSPPLSKVSGKKLLPTQQIHLYVGRLLKGPKLHALMSTNMALKQR